MAWSYSVLSAGATISSSTGFFSGTQSLNPGELAFITINSSFAATASPVTLSVYGCDTNTTVCDNVALVQFEQSTDNDPGQVSWMFSGAPYFVAAATMAGTGEVELTMQLAKDGVSL